ncbi:MAG: hypothetical protein E6Q97_18125 [Desulfurellales bacterium]|nr:MAG: hypothetical protein E6Q97_18125 [Desulfurellales bacterium]
MTYLEAVNEILLRLRENQVSTVSETAYSQLIGKFCNDAKRQVEDAWNWDALSTTITLNTVAGTTNYVVTGSGIRQRDITVNDSSNQAMLRNVPIQWILNQQQLSTVQSGSPVYFAWNGTDGTDSNVEIYPTPDGAYSLKFNMVVPQVNLTADSDTITVPSEPVIMGAYARALAERGEDGGLASSEAYGLFKSILADYIALESNRFIENDVFVAC